MQLRSKWSSKTIDELAENHLARLGLGEFTLTERPELWMH